LGKLGGKKLVKFVAEWVSTTIVLLFEPSKFIPSPEALSLQGAARTSLIGKQVGFGASSIFIALLMFQLVVARSGTGDSWNSARESLPFTLILIGSWVVWSALLAAVLKALGSKRDPLINIVFSIRALATFYVIAMIVAVVAFMAFQNRWAVFQWTNLAVGFSLYAIYVPFIFGQPTELTRSRRIGSVVCIVAIALATAWIRYGSMEANPGTPPTSAPPSPPLGASSEPQPHRPTPPLNPAVDEPVKIEPQPPAPSPQPSLTEPVREKGYLDVVFFDQRDDKMVAELEHWFKEKKKALKRVPVPHLKADEKQEDTLWYYEDADRADALELARSLNGAFKTLYSLRVERMTTSAIRPESMFTLQLLGARQ
jgi:hypothetical protein